MRWIVVSVRDSAVDAFNRPAFVPALGAATRSFQDEVNREHADNVMYHHPEDYELFELGVFDDSIGSFSMLDRPRSVARAVDFKAG